MTEPVRYPYGVRAPKVAARLDLTPLLTGVVPAHPAQADYLAALHGWLMLGNDIAGDCEAARWAHWHRLLSAALTGVEVYPSQDQVWALYKTQNPNFDPNGGADTNGPGSSADGGMDTQTLLEYLHARGEVVCFGTIDHNNEPAIDAALAIFGGLWFDVEVMDANQDDFQAGRPWDWHASSPVDGYHAVLAGGYATDPNTSARFITWGEETALTDAYREHAVQRIWVPITEMHLGTRAFMEGVNVTALTDAYTALTGQPFPVQPGPGPAPVPPPAPSPTPSGDLAVAVADWWSVVEHWAVDERHTGDNRHAALAAQNLARQAGLLA